MHGGHEQLEFLRFGSSIPGGYWGCCACDIIQYFKVDPDAPASIQVTSGDGGGPVGDKFFGPTNKDVFLQRLRVGTFGTGDMPNHAFIAILTQWQINSELGKKWLAILKQCGFEFIRTVNNSVYSGPTLGKPTAEVNNNDNHIFMLIRNIGENALKDPFTPPKAWTDLPSVKPEANEFLSANYDPEVSGICNPVELTKAQHAADTKIWNDIGPVKYLTEKEVEAAGVPVIYAGLRSQFPPQKKADRLAAQGKAGNKPEASLKTAPAPQAAVGSVEPQVIAKVSGGVLTTKA